jgi:hypothetical protein
MSRVTVSMADVILSCRCWIFLIFSAYTMFLTISTEGKVDPLWANILPALKGQLWRHLRTNLTPVFTSRKMKMMFYLVDFCGKELADCLEKATADGKLPQRTLQLYYALKK